MGRRVAGEVYPQVIGPSTRPVPRPRRTLSQCVLRAMDGVALNPPDKKEAQATFSWNFAPGA
jgi:hypothetical protein